MIYYKYRSNEIFHIDDIYLNLKKEKKMSHQAMVRTSFQYSGYFQKALNILKIHPNTSILKPGNLEFSWNGQEYQLIADLVLLKKSDFKSFIEQLVKEYASEFLIGEGRKMGFQAVGYQQNSDGSNLLIFQKSGISH